MEGDGDTLVWLVQGVVVILGIAAGVWWWWRIAGFMDTVEQRLRDIAAKNDKSDSGR